ncbi:MAG: hypothetical protein ABTD50_19440 [Polyangiaceae bacterium]
MTTLGNAADTVRAEVCARAVSKGTYRLVVQSYDGRIDGVPDLGARPVGSVQRDVTAEELRSGISVSLLELRSAHAPEAASKPVVVAWIEAGSADLDFDGRSVRPGAGCVYGVATGVGANRAVRVVLDRIVAG